MNWDHDIRASSKITFSCLPWDNTISSTRCGFPVRTPEYFQEEYFVSKAVWWCNLVKVLGQQPRYQCVPSSVTMWQLFHREPSVLSRHHKLLTRQLLPTYMQWRRWGHRPQNHRSMAREDSDNKGSFRNNGFDLRDSSVMLGHPQLVDIVSYVIPSWPVC